ncbi:hypothetical protein DPV78_000655 [Talaromyces pinophilus]|nr:hypothetical protein DPV78_000655 [Talaromyces pinophilus]
MAMVSWEKESLVTSQFRQSSAGRSFATQAELASKDYLENILDREAVSHTRSWRSPTRPVYASTAVMLVRHGLPGMTTENVIATEFWRMRGSAQCDVETAERMVVMRVDWWPRGSIVSVKLPNLQLSRLK